MSYGRNRHQMIARGFSLVELMVALVIGLVILGTVITVYINNVQSARFQTGVMRAQENGRFAVDVLSRTIRMAGYDATEPVPTPLSGTTSSSGTTFTESGLSASAHTVTASYEGGTEIRNCQGQSVAANTVVSNQFAVWVDADGVSHLVCNTADGDAEALAEGVEDMEVLYGIDSNDDDVANRYVDAGSVANWGQVVAVQISILVNSVVPALGQDDTVCLGCSVFAGSNDRLVRAEFQTTISLRNMVLGK